MEAIRRKKDDERLKAENEKQKEGKNNEEGRQQIVELIIKDGISEEDEQQTFDEKVKKEAQRRKAEEDGKRFEDRVMMELKRLRDMENQSSSDTIAAHQSGRFLEGMGDQTTKRNQSEVTFRDVNESMPKFSGDDGCNLDEWLNDFEQNACLLRWTNFQKLIYAKRLLAGTAKLFMEHECKAKSYDALVTGLKIEFKSVVNSAAIHRRLGERKKKTNETYREYVYLMLGIAAQAEIDTSSIINYIVDGIEGSANNKAFLYESKSIAELKEKLRTYEQIQLKIKLKPVDNRHEKYCFNCGEKTHVSESCPNKGKGPKCFRCNEFGHKSNSCSKFEKRLSKSTMNVVECRTSYKVVTINGVEMEALIDSGSQITTIRKDVFFAKELGKYSGTKMTVCGVGSTYTKAIGVFDVC